MSPAEDAIGAQTARIQSLTQLLEANSLVHVLITAESTGELRLHHSVTQGLHTIMSGN